MSVNVPLSSMRTFSGRNASQLASEIQGLLELMRETECKSYLEIGARHGDTFHYLVSGLPEIRTAVAVDLPGGAWGTPRSVDSLKRAVLNLRQSTRMHPLTVEALIGSSQAEDIVGICRDMGPFDMVLIDADHRYEPVKQDWEVYKCMTRYVAFHDIVGDGQTTHDAKRLPVEVPRLWKELREQYAPHYWEFTAPGSGMGIGVIDVDAPQEQSARNTGD